MTTLTNFPVALPLKDGTATYGEFQWPDWPRSAEDDRQRHARGMCRTSRWHCGFDAMRPFDLEPDIGSGSESFLGSVW